MTHQIPNLVTDQEVEDGCVYESEESDGILCGIGDKSIG